MAPAPIATHVSDEINNAMDKNSIFHKKGADLVNFAVGGTGGKSTVPTMPDFTSKEEEQRYAKEHLACAFRVFAENGFDEGLSGHMSLRDPINPRTFWINP